MSSVDNFITNWLTPNWAFLFLVIIMVLFYILWLLILGLEKTDKELIQVIVKRFSYKKV